jgi:hypothetical protein
VAKTLGKLFSLKAQMHTHVALFHYGALQSSKGVKNALIVTQNIVYCFEKTNPSKCAVQGESRVSYFLGLSTDISARTFLP